MTRRHALGAIAAGAVAVNVPFRAAFPDELEPVLAEFGKGALDVLNPKPLNAQTPVSMLDPDITSNAAHFVRNNGLPSGRADLDGWKLVIDGEVEQPLELTMAQLQADYEHVTRAVVLECGGNGRAGFSPMAKGNQWTLGAVGCAEWTGVRLKDVLAAAGIKPSAIFVAYYGEDKHLSGDPSKVVISRGCSIEKALSDECMLAWAMNGESIPPLHGYPVRLIVPGHPASASGKWLKRLWVRDVVHDGPKMTGKAYRVPDHPVEPGEEVPDDQMDIIEEMPVKSLMTAPASGASVTAGRSFEVRGHAWSGHGAITEVDISFDFGQTWQSAKLSAAPNPFAWQRFRAQVELPVAGYYELWARATDARGVMQPMLVPGWNPKGYLNNAMHRIAVVAS